MSINIERLKIDPRYWKLCGSPDDATHCAVHELGKTWFKIDEGGLPMLWHMRFSEWREGFKADPPVRLIPRPEKSALREWDAPGVPPVGVECEFRIGGGNTKWYSCTVRYVLTGFSHEDADGWRAVVWCPHLGKDQVAHLPRFEFRPIRMPEQCECDEVVEAALSMDCRPSDGMLSRTDFCRALYGAGMLRRPEK
ncbi:hypothetical protein SAMN04488490_1840 [Marinobacter sp. LV10R510-11A]|uniref:hypothetical protein n=1 Tax=Marinobacter sp. LV10R510-11A TaxID=1415568 RepID=UPI000BB935F0|nr:hypothetical protein [Marinobacter sp. LV10R510-11A]SOB76163.1 hypothetical protein SAMN04488490_1840 [Marinobacter sp. LV10R510-11A]